MICTIRSVTIATPALALLPAAPAATALPAAPAPFLLLSSLSSKPAPEFLDFLTQLSGAPSTVFLTAVSGPVQPRAAIDVEPEEPGGLNRSEQSDTLQLGSERAEQCNWIPPMPPAPAPLSFHVPMSGIIVTIPASVVDAAPSPTPLPVVPEPNRMTPDSPPEDAIPEPAFAFRLAPMNQVVAPDHIPAGDQNSQAKLVPRFADAEPVITGPEPAPPHEAAAHGPTLSTETLVTENTLAPPPLETSSTIVERHAQTSAAEFIPAVHLGNHPPSAPAKDSAPGPPQGSEVAPEFAPPLPQPETSPAPVREIRFEVAASDGSQVQLRFVERAGEVYVVTRTADEVLADRLRTGLGELASNLNRQGWEPELWVSGHPAESATSDGGPGALMWAVTQTAETGLGHGSREQQDKGRGYPAWLQQLEDQLEGNRRRGARGDK